MTTALEKHEERVADAMMAPFIEEIADLFAQAGLLRLDGITFRASWAEGGEGRNFAACRTDGRLIVFSPRMIYLPQNTILGILAHELGHAADFLYPARFVSDKQGRAVLLDDTKKGVTAHEKPIPDQWIRDWKNRTRDQEERMADVIAETVLGVRIGYTGDCLLQTLGEGIMPRPPGLR